LPYSAGRIFAAVFLFLVPALNAAEKSGPTETEATLLQQTIQGWHDQLTNPSASKTKERLEQFIRRFLDRDKTAITSDALLLLMEHENSLPNLQIELAKILFANGMSARAKTSVKSYLTHKPDTTALQNFLEYFNDQTFVSPSMIGSVILLLNRLVKDGYRPTDHEHLRIAALLYSVNENRKAKTILRRIPANSSLVPQREFLLATIATKQGLYPTATNILQRLCKPSTEETLQSAACALYGRLLANNGNFEEALKAFAVVPADANLFPTILFEKLWVNWLKVDLQGTLITSQQWQILFPTGTAKFEVERLTALSLLQAKSYQQAIAHFNRLSKLLTFELQNTSDLRNTYRNKFELFLADFLQGTVVIPFSKQTQHFLGQNQNFKRLLRLAQELQDLDELIHHQKARLARLRVFEQNSRVFYQPSQINRLQRGLTLLNLLKRHVLAAEDQAPPEQAIPEAVGTTTKGDKELEKLLARHRQTLERLSRTPGFYLGNKRRAYKRLITRVKKQLQTVRDHRARTLLLQYRRAGLVTARTRGLLAEHLKTKLSESASWTLPKSLQPSYLQVHQNLSNLQPLVRNAINPFAGKSERLTISLNALEKRVSTLKKRLKLLSNKLIAAILADYARDLEHLKHDTLWATINSKHAHLNQMTKREQDLTKTKFDILENFQLHFGHLKEAP